MRETLLKLRRELAPLYPKGEIEAIIRIIFEHLKGWSPVDIVMHGDTELSPFIKGKVDAILERLRNHEPIQYITGEALFYGLHLSVNPSVLIPRPETEELAELVLKHCGEHPDLEIMDAGTGSGCIAIALARNLKFPQITAIDISPEALGVAEKNARQLKCRIKFRQTDILTLREEPSRWDVIVSNPPYICTSERALMEANVLDYEPDTALFVPDNDPLRFYRPLVRYGEVSLKPGGALFFEINPIYADDLVRLLDESGYADVQTHRDIYGKIRFTSAIRPYTDD